MQILRFYDEFENEEEAFNGYNVHMDTSDHTLHFAVYSVQDWSRGEEKGSAYLDKGNGGILEKFDKDKAECLFEGSYCWRGVWEGRIYFKQEEYWDNNLMEMAKLYENQIKPWCEKFIRSREKNIPPY